MKQLTYKLGDRFFQVKQNKDGTFTAYTKDISDKRYYRLTYPSSKYETESGAAWGILAHFRISKLPPKGSANTRYVYPNKKRSTK